MVEHSVNLGVPLVYNIFVFRGRFPVNLKKIKKFLIFLRRVCLLLLCCVLETITIFGLPEERWFTSVIDGSLLRIDLSLPTLLSVF